MDSLNVTLKSSNMPDFYQAEMLESIHAKNILSGYIEYDEFNDGTFMAVLRNRKKLRHHRKSAIFGSRELIWISNCYK